MGAVALIRALMDLSELGIAHYSFYKGWLRWRWSKLSKIFEIFARIL